MCFKQFWVILDTYFYVENLVNVTLFYICREGHNLVFVMSIVKKITPMKKRIH